MAARNPCKDIVAFLVTNTATTQCTSSDTFYPVELPPDAAIPRAAVFCLPISSPAVANHVGGSTAEHRYTVMVVVRGTVNTVEATRARAATILDLLNRAAVPDSVGGGYYTGCTALASAPTFRLFSDQSLPCWSVLAQLTQFY